MARFIYADNAATTRVSDSVLEAMRPYLQEHYGNASSIYKLGRDSQRMIEDNRRRIAEVFGARPNEIFFTSGGSESDNWALKGAAKTLKARGKTHIITTNFEHHAILHTCAALEKEGFSVTYLPVDEQGYITAEQVKNAIRPETGLVSVMFANNEIGTIQPIGEIGAVCREAKVWFHTDAVQAVGHLPIHVDELNIDMFSLSGHKLHAPKGVGLLYVRRGVVLQNLIDGGAQERNKRAGTENLMGIAGLTQAILDANRDIEARAEKIARMRDRLIDGLLTIPQARLNGGRAPRLCGNINVSFPAVEGESLLLTLDNAGICASSGSACTSGSLDPSHVLLAIGLPHEVAHGSLRLSIDETLTDADVDYILEQTPKAVARLRAMSPIWNRQTNG